MRQVKNLAAMMAAGMLALSLVACGGSSTSNDTEKEQEQEVRQGDVDESAKEEAPADEAESDATEEEAPTEEPAKEESKAKVAVTIDGARLSTDYDGDPVVIITYTFTNVSSDEAESYLLSCSDEVYQNGVQCELAFVMDLEGDSSAKVKAGASTTFQKAYSVKDNSDVEVEVKELFSWDDTLLASAAFTF